MKEMFEAGDLSVQRTKGLGIDIYLNRRTKPPKRLCFFNEKGTRKLARWILKTNK